MNDYLQMVAAERAAEPSLSASAAHARVQCSEAGFAAYRQHLSSKGIAGVSPASAIAPRISTGGSAVDEYRRLVDRKKREGLGAQAAHRAVLNSEPGQRAYRESLRIRGIIRGDETL